MSAVEQRSVAEDPADRQIVIQWNHQPVEPANHRKGSIIDKISSALLRNLSHREYVRQGKSVASATGCSLSRSVEKPALGRTNSPVHPVFVAPNDTDNSGEEDDGWEVYYEKTPVNLPTSSTSNPARALGDNDSQPGDFADKFLASSAVTASVTQSRRKCAKSAVSKIICARTSAKKTAAGSRGRNRIQEDPLHDSPAAMSRRQSPRTAAKAWTEQLKTESLNLNVSATDGERRKQKRKHSADAAMLELGSSAQPAAKDPLEEQKLEWRHRKYQKRFRPGEVAPPPLERNVEAPSQPVLRGALLTGESSPVGSSRTALTKTALKKARRADQSESGFKDTGKEKTATGAQTVGSGSQNGSGSVESGADTGESAESDSDNDVAQPVKKRKTRNYVRKDRADQKWECLVCLKLFPWEIDLTGHYRNKHLQDDRLTCRYCPETFSMTHVAKALSVHTNKVHLKNLEDDRAAFGPIRSVCLDEAVITNLRCTICLEYFSNSHRFVRHGTAVHGVARDLLRRSGDFLCDECPRTFANPHAFATHKRELHGAPGLHTPSQWDCKVCLTVLPGARELGQHVKDNHLVDGRVPCRFCQKPYRYDTLRTHFAISHTAADGSLVAVPETQPQLPCKICGKTFVTRGFLSRHVRHTHKGVAKNRKSRAKVKAKPVVMPDESAEPVIAEIGGAAEENTVAHGDREDFAVLEVPRSWLDANHDDEPQLASHEDSNGVLGIVNGDITGEKPQNRYQAVFEQEAAGVLPTISDEEPHDDAASFVAEIQQNPLQCALCGRNFRRQSGLLLHMRIHKPNLLSAEEEIEGETQPTYQCESCSRAFTRKSALVNHTPVHLRNLLDCIVCRRQFDGKASLDAHVAEHFVAPVPCRICAKPFHTVSHLKGHITRYHTNALEPDGLKAKKRCGRTKQKPRKLGKKSGRMQCPVCFNWLKSAIRLRYHVQNLHVHPLVQTSADPKLKCDVCQLVLLTNLDLRNHAKTHLAKPTGTRTQCPVCRKRFPRSQVETHIQSHLDDSGTAPCLFCDKRMPPDELKRHYQVNHSTANFGAATSASGSTGPVTQSTGPYACDFCGVLCNTRDILVRHRKTMHSALLETRDGSGQFVCDICARKFHAKPSLAVHKMRMHNMAANSESKKCKVCLEQFNDHTELGAHIKTHAVDAEGRVQCRVCRKAYPYSTLRKHMLQHEHRSSGEDADTVTVKPHACELCVKTYSTAKALAEHKDAKHIRKNAFDFQCDVCMKRFRRDERRKIHMKKFHSGA